MQDFNYLFSNCMEITVELSCVKNPPADTLQAEWEMNREPLMAFLEASGAAARGVVTRENGQPANKAVVKVSGHAKDIVTTSRGEWWRILTPGNFLLSKDLNLSHMSNVHFHLREVYSESRIGKPQEQRGELT